MNPRIVFAPSQYARAARIKKKKTHLSLHFSLILYSAEVALGTFKHRLVVSAEVTVPSVPVPAGQHRAITAL